MAIQLLEGFESIVADVPQGRTWNATFTVPGSLTASTSHVTEGTYSGHWDYTGGSGFAYLETNIPDLTGFDFIRLDVYAPNAAGDFGVALGGYDNIDFNFNEVYLNGATGAQTLTMDISGWTNKTDITLWVLGSNASGSHEFFSDNLRAEG